MQGEYKVTKKAYRDILDKTEIDATLIYQMLYDLNERLEEIEKYLENL